MSSNDARESALSRRGVDLITPLDRHDSDAQPDAIRILHVDDEPDFVEMAAEFIEQIDDRFTVITETSASAGLDRLSKDPYDCVISDYQMPTMDGLDFLEAVRQEYPDLPFILCTGRGSEEVASKALSKGVTDYIQKGAGRDQHEVLVNRVLNAVEAYRMKAAVWTTVSWYQRLVEQNLAGIYLIQHGEFVYVNDRMAEIFGYEQEEMMDLTPEDVVDPADHDILKENLRRREEGEVDNVQYSLTGIRQDGSRIEIQVHGGVIEFEDEPAILGLLLADSG